MNAITDIAQALTLLPITDINPSPSAVQAARRERFKPEQLLELAVSIKNLGVQQPIIVRPSPPRVADGVARPYEIVCGERRWIAADRAGLENIPAIIRELDDETVLEIQLVENLQREGLHPLEEGEGYRELMRLKHIDAESVGELIGKSRAYVYSRTKLLDLCAPARAALQAGQLDTSKALLLARIQPEKRQVQATTYLLNVSHYSYDAAAQSLRHKFMTRLHGAPFDPTISDYVTLQKTQLPPCATCPHNSANDPDLADPRAPDAHVCTDRLCFDQKTRAHTQRIRTAAEAAGKTILSGTAAKRALPGPYQSASATHLQLDARCDDIEYPEPEPAQGKDETKEAWQARIDAWEDRRDAWEPPTYRELLAPHTEVEALAVYAEDKDRLVPLIATETAAPLLEKAGITLHRPMQRNLPLTDEERAFAAAQKKRDDEKRAIDTEYRKQLFIAALQKWRPPATHDDLKVIAEELLGQHHSQHISDALDAVFKVKFDIDTAKDSELLRYILAITIADDLDFYHIGDKPTRLLALAERQGIDLKAIKATAIAVVRPTSVPKEAVAAKRKTPGKGKKSNT